MVTLYRITVEVPKATVSSEWTSVALSDFTSNPEPLIEEVRKIKQLNQFDRRRYIQDKGNLEYVPDEYANLLVRTYNIY